MNVPAGLRHVGNPLITVWCPTCSCRVVTLRDGSCGWCDAPISGEARDLMTAKLKAATEKRERAEAARLTRERKAAEREHRRAERERLRGIHLGRTTHKVVQWLDANGPAAAQELAGELDITPAAARVALSHLRRRGLVERIERRPVYQGHVVIYQATR